MRCFIVFLLVSLIFSSPSYAVQEGDIYQCEGEYYKISEISDIDFYLTYGYDTAGYDKCNQLGVGKKGEYERSNTCTHRILNVRIEYRNGGPKLYGKCYILYTDISLTKISKPAPPCGENPPDDDNDGVCNQCDTKPGEPDPKDCMPGYTVGSDGNQNGWFIDPGCSGRANDDLEFWGSHGFRQNNSGGYIGDDVVPLAEPTQIPPKTCTNQSNGTCGCGYAPSTVGPGRATPPYNQDYPDISTLGGEGGGSGTGEGGGSGTGEGGGSGTGEGGGSGTGEGGGSGTGEGGGSGTGEGGGTGTGGTEGGGSGTGGTEGGGSGTGEGGGDGNGEDNKDKEEPEKFGSIGRPGASDAYSPGEELKVSDRFQQMVNTIKGTKLFNFSTKFFEGVPSGGSSVVTFNGGSRYGTHTVNLSDTMGSALATFKAVVMAIFSFLSIRAVIMKR